MFVALVMLGIGVHRAGFAAEPAPPPPADAFFKHPDMGSAVLSPSGRWLAITSNQVGSRVALVVFDLVDWGKVTLAASFADADVDEVRWLDDERVLFSIADSQSGSAEQAFAGGLIVVRRDGSEMDTLVSPGSSWRYVGGGRVHAGHRLLHIPDDGSGSVILGETRYANTGEPRHVIAKRLHVASGRLSNLSLGMPDNTFNWWFDRKGEPRVVLAKKDGRDLMYTRKSEQEDWQLVADHDSLTRPFFPAFFDAAGQLYVTAADGPAGYHDLRLFDFARRAPRPEPLARIAGFDFIGGVISEVDGGRALGVRLQGDAETTVWFDESLKRLQQEADQKLPGRINRLSCRRCGQADMVALVFSYSDRDPGAYLVYSAQTKTWRLVGQRIKAIDARLMGLRDFHRTKARDGRDLPLWVTMPPGPPTGPRPAVVLVHEGPWERGGFWAFDPLAQFLATRGYVVIEPEFRGSWGYGMAHFRAGFKQWGLAMQDDVADALAFAVGRGWVDRQRVCIAGSNYGGYAALMGLARQADLFRCGAAWGAITDPRQVLKWSWNNGYSEQVRDFSFPQLIGDPEKDAQQMKATAPIELAASIKAPVLLAAGAWDRRVPFDHSTRMRDALKAAGNPAEWMPFHDEGSSLQRPQNRIDFANRLQAFLDRHLKAAAPAAPR